MRQMTVEEKATMEALNDRSEIRDFLKLAMTLSQEQQKFLIELLTICKEKGIRADEAWDSICTKYGMPKTHELNRSFQS